MFLSLIVGYIFYRINKIEDSTKVKKPRTYEIVKRLDRDHIGSNYRNKLKKKKEEPIIWSDSSN